LTSSSLLSGARRRSAEAAPLQPVGDPRHGGRPAPPLLALAIVTTPLAGGSSGAPLWAIAVAVVVVAVALCLMFVPDWRPLARRGKAEPGAQGEDAEAPPTPHDSEALPGDQ
jgi:hypothetical protein